MQKSPQIAKLPSNMTKREIVILCLVGPAGSGKTTMMLNLIAGAEPGTLKNSVSVTSRLPRSEKEKGVTREFVTEQEFQQLIKDDALFEHEMIHGHYYGTRRSILDNAIAGSYDLVFDIDFQGALSLKEQYPNNVSICFMMAPEEELIKRIKRRSDVSEEELKTRLATMKQELQWLLDNSAQVDYFVLNKERDETLQTLAAVLEAERVRLKRFDISEIK